MRKLIIKEPIWGSKSVGVREDLLIDDLEIEIAYKDHQDNRVFPLNYVLKQGKGYKYPVQEIKGRILHIIPIEDLPIKILGG